MKKIVIDISRLHPKALKRGVGIYALNLFKAFQQLKDGNKYFLKRDGKKEIRADLIHYPYFDPFFLTLPCVGRIPRIVTVHDLTPLRFPQHYPAGVKGSIKWQIQKYLLKKVNAVIADSRNSKKDIVDIINYPEDKIFPIYLAVDEVYQKIEDKGWNMEIKEKYDLPDKFILYVGDLNWNKNLLGLVEVFSAISHPQHHSVRGKQPSAISLIFIGSAFSNENLKELKTLKKQIKRLKLSDDVRLLGFVPTNDLAVIYNLAALYIQPSFYEGFGLPVLEAMSCGCPVLSSNQASLPEVGGEAVEYFDPNKKGDLERKIRSLLINQKRLKELEKLGLKQAKKFSWRKTAEQTVKVYQKVFKNELKA